MSCSNHQDLNDSTYLLCKDLPSVLNESVRHNNNFENTLNLRTSTEHNLLNAFHPKQHTDC